MAYLGFHKRGANFCWPLVLTQRGEAKPSFPIFSYGEKNIVAKEGRIPNPPKYATDIIQIVFTETDSGSLNIACLQNNKPPILTYLPVRTIGIRCTQYFLTYIGYVAVENLEIRKLYTPTFYHESRSN